VEVVWVTGECSIRQRTSVCSRVDEGAKWDVGNKNKIVNSIPPIDRMDEPRTGTVSLVLCRS